MRTSEPKVKFEQTMEFRVVESTRAYIATKRKIYNLICGELIFQSVLQGEIEGRRRGAKNSNLRERFQTVMLEKI